MTSEAKFIPVLVRETAGDDRENMFPQPRRALLRVAELPADLLRENFQQVINEFASLMDGIDDTDKYSVDSATLSLSITAGGKVALIGELNAGAASGVTVVMKRKAPCLA